MNGNTMLQALIKFRNGKHAIYDYIVAPKSISDQPFFRIQGTLGEIVIDGSFEGGGRIFFVQDAKAEETKV